MKINITLSVVLGLCFAGMPMSADAGRLCQVTSGANKDRVEFTNNTRCGNGKREVLATTQFFYGSGSCGDLTIAESTSLENPGCQYRNITIQAGATLSVVSGSIIRCTGSFTNNGTITVAPGVIGGQIEGISSLAIVPAMQPAHPGNSTGSAGSGSIVSSSTGTAVGGTRSQGNNGSSSGMLVPALIGGGGGGAAYSPGGRGGGALTVLCKGLINNVGTISAAGQAGPGIGSGGGAGGVVTLASQTRVVQTGTVSVVGGVGGNSTSLLNLGDGSLLAVSAGGGGAGGLIQIFAPDLGIVGGANLVSGGSAGSVNDSAIGISNILIGGGAGGSSIMARGGVGGTINYAESHIIDGNAGAGDAGAVVSRAIDPASIF